MQGNASRQPSSIATGGPRVRRQAPEIGDKRMPNIAPAGQNGAEAAAETPLLRLDAAVRAFAARGATRFWAIRLAVILALDALIMLGRSEEHTSELQSLMRISYAVFCLKKKKKNNMNKKTKQH